MSTKTQQVSNAQYNPQSMALFNQLTGSLGPALSGYINNPFSNPFFQTQQQMGTRQANLMGQSAMSNISRNWTASGMGGSNSPALLEMMNNQMRANSSNRANLGFLNPVNNALLMQQNAMGMAAGYRPLQTGQTQTETKSGTGTWLPQLLGGGLSLLTGGLLGGGGAGGGGMNGSPGAWAALNSPMSSPFIPAGYNNWNRGMGQNAPDVGGYNYGPSPFMMGQPSAPSF